MTTEAGRPLDSPRPCPKPVRQPRRQPTGLTRSRFRAHGPRTQKSGGHLFPAGVDEQRRRFVCSLPCLLTGAVYGRPLTDHDVSLGLAWCGFAHRCWGAMTPAHVGKHQAQGVPDKGRMVPLCAAAHRYYDEHRRSWAQVTGYTEARMLAAAAQVEAEYVRGGVAGLPTPESETQ